jgi:hypothetical protein
MLTLATYRVVFDITRDARPDNAAEAWLVVALMLAASIILVLVNRRLPALFRYWFPAVFVLFSLLGVFALLFRNILRPSELAAAYRAGKCEVVEGIVTQFHPMPAIGHDVESFVVAGKRFQYSDYIMTAGFNRTSSHGGPVREGLHVRIYYLGGDIAKLEIADDQASNQALERTATRARRLVFR